MMVRCLLLWRYAVCFRFSQCFFDFTAQMIEIPIPLVSAGHFIGLFYEGGLSLKAGCRCRLGA